MARYHRARNIIAYDLSAMPATRQRHRTTTMQNHHRTAGGSKCNSPQHGNIDRTATRAHRNIATYVITLMHVQTSPTTHVNKMQQTNHVPDAIITSPMRTTKQCVRWQRREQCSNKWSQRHRNAMYKQTQRAASLVAHVEIDRTSARGCTELLKAAGTTHRIP